MMSVISLVIWPILANERAEEIWQKFLEKFFLNP